MKKQKLKNYLKIGILSFGITLLTTNCQKDDNLETKVSELKIHSLDEMTLTDFLNSNPYQTFKETVPNKGGNNLSYRSINPKNDYEFNSSKVLTTNLDGEKTYTAAIRKTDGSDQDYNLNLMIKENSLDTRTYIVKHAKDGSNIIIQPVNFSPNIPTTPDGYKCVGVGWSTTTPCPCAGHTSSSGCTCSTKPYDTRGTVTVCWDEPIDIPDIPIGTGGTDIAIVGNAGGTVKPIKHTQPPKIYIYEGEEQCFSSGECTPQLYWAQVVAENEYIEDSFFDDQIINELTGKADCVYNKLNSSSTGFKNAIKKFDGKFPVSHLKFEIDPSMQSNTKRAYTRAPENYVIDIVLNGNSTKDASYQKRPNLLVAKTIIHEVIHAEMFRKLLSLANNNGSINVSLVNQMLQQGDYPGMLDYYFRNGEDINSNWQHQQMATHYRKTIGRVLQEFDTGITVPDNQQPSQLYMDLAWEGLNHSNLIAWQQAISQTERDRINQVINNYINQHSNQNCTE